MVCPFTARDYDLLSYEIYGKKKKLKSVDPFLFIRHELYFCNMKYIQKKNVSFVFIVCRENI